MPSARKLYWQRLKHIIENAATNISDVFLCVRVSSDFSIPAARPWWTARPWKFFNRKMFQIVWIASKDKSFN